ncbi:MAG TPA: LysR family transcriptional regulator [Acidimicrobiales bacterium]|nr:LysR family transcriptional regulator [Acidimicrobiales bacterium]
MNLNQLRFVRAVVDAGTFTAAAEQCFVTQSTLSTGVALLEKELGAKLFVRTTRSVSLTPFGRGLLPRIDKILAAHSELQRAAEELAGADAEVVRLGVCPLVDSRRLEEVLRPYRDANRNVRVVLEQLDGVEPKVVLDEGRFHFVIGPSETRRRPLERALLYEDPLVYVAGAGAGAAGEGPVRLQEIAADTFLLVNETCGLTLLTRQLFKSRRLALHEYEGRGVSFPVLEEWAAVGLGSAILPRSKVSSPDQARPIVFGNGHPATIRFDAVWSPSAIRSPHLEALARQLKAAARNETGPV